MGTMRDVARDAGVSISTVSRVLNRSASISAETTARVSASIARVSYRPSNVARTLRANRSTTIGLLVSDVQNSFFTALVRGVEDVAQGSGYSVILCNSDENLGKERQYVEVLCSERVAGAIVVPATEQSDSFRLFRESGIPFITADRKLNSENVDSVLVDNFRGSYEAVTHLVGVGYRRIGIVTGPLDTTTGRERLAGYRKALEDARLPRDERLERVGTFKSDSAGRLAEELLDADPPLDALFFANNQTTLGGLAAIAARGMRVPQDIGVIGFDDLPWMELPGVSLTAVRQPTYDLGRTAALRLFDRMQAPERMANQIITLSPRLVVRSSASRPAE